MERDQVDAAEAAAAEVQVAVAVVGTGFSAHGSPVEFASMPNLNNNVITLHAEAYSALLQHDAGAAVVVELV